jgi:hypothetical protein
VVKLQVLGNNSKTVNNIKNLTWNKNFGFDLTQIVNNNNNKKKKRSKNKKYPNVTWET